MRGPCGRRRGQDAGKNRHVGAGDRVGYGAARRIAATKFRARRQNPRNRRQHASAATEHADTQHPHASVSSASYLRRRCFACETRSRRNNPQRFGCTQWGKGLTHRDRRPQPNSQTRGQCRSIREDGEGAAKDRVGTRYPRASAPAPDPIRGSSAANPASPQAPIACGSIRSRPCRVQPKIVLPQMNPGSGPGQAQMHADILVLLAASRATSRISGKSLRGHDDPNR